MGRSEADLLKWSSEDKCLVKASKLAKDLEQVVQWWGLFSEVLASDSAISGKLQKIQQQKL